MMIKDFGAQVESVWEGLRPVTKKMLVGALQDKSANPTALPTRKFSYDTQLDWELSRLLTALDEQAQEAEVRSFPERLCEIRHLADTCITLLQAQTESAEVFIQLAERALARNDFKQFDQLADLLLDRFSANEVCEVARQTSNPAIRAVAMETLVLMPVEELLSSLEDPIYEYITRLALEQKAFEFESEDARQVIDQLGFLDELSDE